MTTTTTSIEGPFNRRLSKSQATSIANSQVDLGGKSKQDMITALSLPWGDSDDSLCREAMSRLDNISQLIVRVFLENETIEDAQNYLDYIHNTIKRAASCSCNTEIPE